MVVASTVLAYALTSALAAPAPITKADDDTMSIAYIAGACPPYFGAYDPWMHEAGPRGHCGRDGQEADSACLSRLGQYNAWLYNNNAWGVWEQRALESLDGPQRLDCL